MQHVVEILLFLFKSWYLHWFCRLLLSVYPPELSCSALSVSSLLCCFVVVCLQYKYRQLKGSSSALFLWRSAEVLSSFRTLFPLHLSFCISVFFLVPLFYLCSENKTSLLFKTWVLLRFRMFSDFMLFKLHLEELMNEFRRFLVNDKVQKHEKNTLISEIMLHGWALGSLNAAFQITLNKIKAFFFFFYIYNDALCGCSVKAWSSESLTRASWWMFSGINCSYITASD